MLTFSCACICLCPLPTNWQILHINTACFKQNISTLQAYFEWKTAAWKPGVGTSSMTLQWFKLCVRNRMECQDVTNPCCIGSYSRHTVPQHWIWYVLSMQFQDLVSRKYLTRPCSDLQYAAHSIWICLFAVSSHSCIIGYFLEALVGSTILHWTSSLWLYFYSEGFEDVYLERECKLTMMCRRPL